MTNRRTVIVVSACVALAYAAPGSAQPKKNVEIVGAPHVQGFSVTLVLGDMQGASTPDNVPVGAQKALADMRDFLPYKSYRLLDTQWILCCGSSKVGVGVSGRLRGVSQIEGNVGATVPIYGFAVTVLGMSGTQLSIRFVLNDEPSTKYAASRTAEEAAIALMHTKQEQKAVEILLEQARKQHTPNDSGIQELETQLGLLDAKVQHLSNVRASGKGAVIDSTFSMDVGETVVIGTSSLKGNKALIAVLTAVPRRHLQSPPEREEP